MDMPTATDKLIARKEGAIGWIIFNNPQNRNAMSLEMWRGDGGWCWRPTRRTPRCAS